MTEAEAEVAICAHVSRETSARLHAYVALLREENERQNLVAASTLGSLWQRHIFDSAQLVPLVENPVGIWVDIGSGAGLPGLVVAILRPQPCILIEPRAKRAAFLAEAAQALGISDRVTIQACKASVATPVKASVISARAVAALPELFAMGLRFATPDTIWLLPKGRSAADELAAARASWQGAFKLVPSQTDSSASIVVARGVRPRKAQ